MGCKSQACDTVIVKHSRLSVLSYPLHLNKIPESVLNVTHCVLKESQTRLPGGDHVDSSDNKFGNSCHCVYDTVL